jgi:hypothetical protein
MGIPHMLKKRLLLIILVGLGWPLAGAEVAFKQLRIGKAVVSLPAHWTTLGPEIPVWLHLHGAPGTVEANFAGIGAPGVLVNVTLPGLSKVYSDHFTEPQVFVDLLRETEAVLRRESPAQAWTPGRLTVSSFSAGFGGVRQLLRQPAALERIAVLVLADSIYCGYAGDIAEKRVDASLMEGFLHFAQLAVEGKRRMLITHTQQVPEGYASTTETANYLIAKLGGQRVAEVKSWGPALRQRSRYSCGGVEIIGFEGSRPEDHMQHLRSLGEFFKRAGAAPQ